MSKVSKDKLIIALTTKVELFNRYVRICLKVGIKADLTGADLTGANLTGADLTGADLRRANLTGADLTEADLRMADLRMADLRMADLTGANLDFATFKLRCGFGHAKTNERLRKQFMAHTLSFFTNSDNLSDEEKQLLEKGRKYIKGWHRENEFKV